jgi:serine/threonine protein kinase
MSHMAPEVMLQGRISKAADVYSFGISLWDLFTGGRGTLNSWHLLPLLQEALLQLRNMLFLLYDGCLWSADVYSFGTSLWDLFTGGEGY